MLILLLISAFMSGSETAFFNLSHRQKKSFATSSHKLQQMAARLLKRPGRLLNSLLFGNMAVNVMFFALASVLSVQLGSSSGASAAAITAVGSFIVLLLFGEMVPKSLAYSNSKTFATMAAPVCIVTVRLFSGLLGFIDFVMVAPLVRLLLWPTEKAKTAETVTANQFKLLIESSRQRGLITADENHLLAEVVELSLLKVRNVMKPRVDMIACPLQAGPDEISRTMLKNNLTKIPIYDGDIDNIVGLLYHRNLLLNPDSKIEKLLEKTNFVPEQKSVESLLEFFRDSSTETAIVVDEYGGIAGAVSLEDIVEEIVGPMEPAEPAETVQQTGALEYRLAGGLSIHDWADAFGIDPAQSRLSTVAGLTSALLGKIPKEGDTVNLKNLTITVEKVKNRRIETLRLLLHSPSQ